MPPSVIIVVPCYNEEKRLPVAAYREFAARCRDFHFLLVNDGSSDGTLEILRNLAASDPELFEVLDVQPNGGKAEAVRLGFQKAFESRPKMVGFWDSDLATPLDELPLFLDALKSLPEKEIILGARVQLLGREIHRNTLRHYLGRIFATTASNYLRWFVYDTQCGAKLFRNNARVRHIFREPFISRWIFDVELLVRFKKICRRQGLGNGDDRIYEQPLRKWEDVKGSTVKGRDFVKAFFEFLAIVRKYR